MLIGGQFAAAKLDIGDELQALRLKLSEEAAQARAADMGPGDLAVHYEDMAEALGRDPFLIHGHLSEQLAVFPDERCGLAVSLRSSMESASGMHGFARA